MKEPATAEAGLEQLMAEAEMWIRRCEVVMVKLGPASGKPPGRELRRCVEEAASVLDNVKKTAGGAARAHRARLTGTASRLNGR